MGQAQWALEEAQWAAMGMPVQKAKNFRSTLIRLLGYFMPQKFHLLVVFVAAMISTVFTVVGPKILGLATTKLFEGIVARIAGMCQGPASISTYIGNILLIYDRVVSYQLIVPTISSNM